MLQECKKIGADKRLAAGNQQIENLDLGQFVNKGFPFCQR
jgi:hypothetical protein